METKHIPVLLKEVIQYLVWAQAGVYVDATIGEGGHGQAILEATPPQVKLLAMDRDAESLASAKVRLAPYADRVIWVRENFKNLPEVLKEMDIPSVAGVLWDMGLSSAQLSDHGRGFSFQEDGPLDMRQDQRQGQTAADLVNRLPVEDLANIIYRYGEERFSRRIARAIVEARRHQRLDSTRRLAEIVYRAIPAAGRSIRIHPATKTFQALRIAVNEELTGLDSGIVKTVEVLTVGGRFCIISYHSLEDRLVKQTFRSLAGACRRPTETPVSRQAGISVLTPRPVTPTEAEVNANPRARSAKMRVVQRIC